MSDDGARSAGYRGRTVGNGRFQLQNLLGEGGMASVYLAYDSVLDRRVAVKTLHTELGREQSFRERFRREAQSVAKLTHTNIVSVFDSGEDTLDGAPVPYIVMEYVEGKPLRTVLDEDIAQFGAMPADKALKIVGDVLGALDASHELGLVHRDIKPGNVMVTKRGVVKVMDFGIARAMQSGVSSMTQTGMVVGTPQYLSPEQALGRGVDTRSDLYSVGIMLFELLTGRLPFAADSPLAVAYAHVQEEPVAPSTVNRSVSPAVDALVARALRKNPNERFPTAESMRAECDRVRGSGVATGAAPHIVGGGPAASGAGVGQAVFPPVNGAGTPPPPTPAQPPFQQQYAWGSTHAESSGAGFSPPTPPTATPAGAGPGLYPHPSAYGPQASRTPPPYGGMTRPPTGLAPNGGRRNSGVVIGTTIAAVVVIVILIIAISLINSGTSGSSSDTPASGGDTSSQPQVDGFRPEDTSRELATSACKDRPESFSEEGEISLPQLKFYTLSSVKECIRSAGWQLGDVTYVDENVWGKNMVVEQSPGFYKPFDPEEGEIDLTVSTGMPGD